MTSFKILVYINTVIDRGDKASLYFLHNGKDYITKKNINGYYCTERAGHDKNISGFTYKWLSEMNKIELII